MRATLSFGAPFRLTLLFGAACTLAAISAVDAQGPSATASSTITRIELERDCPGCPTGSKLVLSDDGTAVYALTGKARFSSEDRTSTGSIDAKEFARLANFIESHGFFKMKAEYDDPATRDGAWTATSVFRGSEETKVFRRDDAGPAALKTIEQQIDATRRRIEFRGNAK